MSDGSPESRLLLQRLVNDLTRIEGQLDKLVPREVWQTAHSSLQRQLDDHITASRNELEAARKELRRAIDDVDKRSVERHTSALDASKEVAKDLREYREERKGQREFSWSRALGLALVLVTLIGALITVLATKGGP